jgi:hypothetical protein
MRRRIGAAVLLAAAFGFCTSAQAQAVRVTDAFGDPPKAADVLDLFNAIENETVAARVVVRDQFHAKVVLENLTDAPVALNIPQFLAAQPVLAQFNFPGLTNQQPGSTSSPTNSGSNLPQSVGGSPNSSPGLSTTFQGSGPFNIAPEQVRTIDLPCFCLEHGKPNPRTAIKYELVPLADANDDPRLPGVIEAFARGQIDRDSAQAAVWHAANDMDWNELAALSTRVALNADRPLFNSVQLRRAKAVVDRAVKSDGAAKQPTATAKTPATSESKPTVNASPTKKPRSRDRDRDRI